MIALSSVKSQYYIHLHTRAEFVSAASEHMLVYVMLRFFLKILQNGNWYMLSCSWTKNNRSYFWMQIFEQR